MSAKQLALFDDRFLESFVGKGIISDPKIAIIELIANAWDAPSTFPYHSFLTLAKNNFKHK